MTYIARCCCQACSLQVEGEPVLNALCHCDNCKRRTGSGFGWSAYFLDGQLTRQVGAFSRYHVRSTDADRFFCAACGTTLYWTSATFMPGHTGVAGGCFAETPLPEPTMSACDSQRCAWLTLPTGWLAAP
ncbi:MAG TPA: GFA family protein [Caulobacteraceae bacterium]